MVKNRRSCLRQCPPLALQVWRLILGQSLIHRLDYISQSIDRFNRSFGRIIAFLTLFMVILQFLIVILRYIFGIGSIFIQESIMYQHAMIFMLGTAYTFLSDKHVRLDIFYRETGKRNKSIINVFGVTFFLIPVCILIWIYAFPYVSQAWRVLEGSRETSGLPFVYLLKTTILIFSVLLGLQAISILLRSLLELLNLKKS